MPLLRRTIHGLPVWAIVAAAAVALGPQRPALGAAKPVALRIDYLPNLVYDGERLVLCGAVMNRTSKNVQANVYCSLERPATPGDEAVIREVVAVAGREGRFEAAWKIVDLEEPAALSVALGIGEQELEKVTVVVHPASLKMPELALGDGFLTDATGRRVVLVVRRQVPQRASRWAVVKWVEHAVTGGKVEPSAALFVGDLLAKDEAGSYLSLLKVAPALSRFSFLAVKHPVKSARARRAILRTLCAFSRSALKRRYDLTLIFVGSEEARFGTDVGEFRKAIDLMSGLAKAQGCPHVAFVCPVAREKLSGRITRYRRAVMSVAHASGARVFDPQPAVARAGWGNGRVAGADARKALADGIAGFVNAVTVK